MYLLHTQLCAWACYKTPSPHRHNVRSAFVLEGIGDSPWITDESSTERHTLVNLLGAIGTLMEGSGLDKLLEEIYGENAVVHRKPYRERSEDIC